MRPFFANHSRQIKKFVLYCNKQCGEHCFEGCKKIQRTGLTFPPEVVR